MAKEADGGKAMSLLDRLGLVYIVLLVYLAWDAAPALAVGFMGVCVLLWWVLSKIYGIGFWG